MWARQARQPVTTMLSAKASTYPTAGMSSLRPFLLRPFAGLVRKGDISEPAPDILMDENLFVLQAENKQLRAKIAELKWPRVNSFMAFGKKHKLPWKAKTSFDSDKLHGVTAASLRYLTGFFDGDGNVHHGYGYNLRVGQSYDRAEVLVLFASELGGHIYSHCPGKGLKKPVLLWVQSRCSLAAGLLATHSITKQRQLQVAAESSATTPDKNQLSILKKYDSAVTNFCSWEYLAGFFDAEGCIILNGCHPAIMLAIEQKHATVLACLRNFLQSEMGCQSQLHARPRGFRLQVCNTAQSKQILGKMLHAGLLQKAEQAKLALGATRNNIVQIRNALAELKGNQHFARRLDEAGLDRARIIRNELRRANYAMLRGHQDRAAAILRNAQQLKRAHAFCRAELENQELRGYFSILHAQCEADASTCSLLHSVNSQRAEGVDGAPQ